MKWRYINQVNRVTRVTYFPDHSIFKCYLKVYKII